MELQSENKIEGSSKSKKKKINKNRDRYFHKSI